MPERIEGLAFVEVRLLGPASHCVGGALLHDGSLNREKPSGALTTLLILTPIQPYSGT